MILENIKIKDGYPWFVDVWILLKSGAIVNEKQNMLLTELDKLSRLNLSNW